MILVTGANGQLGQCFRQLADQFPAFRFLFAASSELDITDRKAVFAFFQAQKEAGSPLHWCINCAAYTAVDRAESEAAQARRVNVQGPRNLAAACSSFGAQLLHFSTDYVYHRQQATPFVETDPVSPKGVYARTKRAGERAAQRALPLAMIIRTSWVYAAQGHNFLNTMLRLGAVKPSLGIVFDQIGTPTYAPDLARAVLNILQKADQGEIAREALAGIWHYSNEGVASWYDFAQAIFEIRGLPCRALPIETKAYPTPAERPPFSVLNKGKIKAAFGLEIPHWREGLERAIALGKEDEATKPDQG